MNFAGFVEILHSIQQHPENLTASQHVYLRYLEAWKNAYDGDNETAIARLNNDKEYAEEAMKAIQFVPHYETGANINAQVRQRLEVKPEIRQFVADYIKSAKR